MKSTTVAATNFLNGVIAGTQPAQMWMPMLYTITLVSGTILLLTDSTQNISYGGNMYLCSRFPGGPYVKSGSVTTNLGLEVNTMDLTVGAGAANQINGLPLLQAAIEGYFDGAAITVDMLVGATIGDTSLGTVNVFDGTISDITQISRVHFAATCKSSLELLNLQIPRVNYQPGCRWTLFDAGCGLIRSSFAVTGAITSGTTAKVLDTNLSGVVGIINPPTVAPSLSQNNNSSISTPPQTLFAVVTYVYALGETPPSPEAYLAMNRNNLLTVASPAATTGATGYNVYVGYSPGAELLQNSSPIAIGTNWTENATTLIVQGASVPTTSSTGNYAQGWIKFTSGVLSGWAASIESNTGSVLTLRAVLPNTPRVGDTFTAYPGCSKDFSRCITLQGSMAQAFIRFGGQRDIPTPESGF